MLEEIHFGLDEEMLVLIYVIVHVLISMKVVTDLDGGEKIPADTHL